MGTARERQLQAAMNEERRLWYVQRMMDLAKEELEDLHDAADRITIPTAEVPEPEPEPLFYEDRHPWTPPTGDLRDRARSKAAVDIRAMSMSEFTEYRRELGMPERGTRGGGIFR